MLSRDQTEYHDDGLEPGTTYEYIVTARDHFGNLTESRFSVTTEQKEDSSDEQINKDQHARDPSSDPSDNQQSDSSGHRQ